MAVSPNPVTMGTTFNIAFTVEFHAADPVQAEFIDRFEITVPGNWTINSVYNTLADAGRVGGCSTSQAGISGQMAFWQTGCAPSTGQGAWVAEHATAFPGIRTHDFVANVTVASCDGAPWSLPWAIFGDRYRETPDPHVVSGAVQVYAEGCPAPTVPVPGCNTLNTIPSRAVVGMFLDNAIVFWAPGEMTTPPIVVQAGKTYWVDGLDPSGKYWHVLISCTWVWIPASQIGPNPQPPWNGAPLPGHSGGTGRRG
jgi:hypothetical protein